MSKFRNLFGSFPLAELLVPGCVTASLLVMFFNIPGALMDWLLAMNIALSLIILLTTFFVRRPIEFSIFPSLLLATTLFRLTLNVGTTRLILTRADDYGPQAAGEVINAFSRFVAGENIVVGMVIFGIFVIIQFVVITKGATRISEVAARFALDALPGRQMAIDAELGAGTIDAAEAKRRREELTDESDFYGAMDGAGKFVRGDAIAGLAIIFINIIGGFLIGTIQNGRAPTDTFALYTRLTIGDGLVAQVPALLISLATGLLVSRSNRPVDLSKTAVGQLLARPEVFGLGGFFLVLLMFTGMPPLPLSALAAGCFALAIVMTRKNQRSESENVFREERARQEKKIREEKESKERVENYLAVDPLELAVGVGLVRVVEPDSGVGMIDAIRRIRAEVASELGVILPKVRLRDHLELDENRYEIRVGTESVAEGILWPSMFLAVDVERTGSRLEGIRTVDPASLRPAFWIEGSRREKAEIFGFQILTPAETLAAHLKATVCRRAADLLTRESLLRLIASLKAYAPAIVDELIPNQLKLGEVQQALKRLLRERVSIRPLETVLETFGDYADRTKNPILLAEQVRLRLAGTICAPLRDAEGSLHVLMLDPQWEEIIGDGAQWTDDEIRLTISPEERSEFRHQIGEMLRNVSPDISSVALLVSPAIRPTVRELTAESFPDLPVLSYKEIASDVRMVTEGIVRQMRKVA